MRVVFVIAGSLRRDLLSCYGNTWLKCENIELLARHSLKFTSARVDRPDPLAVRLALMTGLAESRFLRPAMMGSALAGDCTLPGLLADGGCLTGLITDSRHVLPFYQSHCEFDFILYQPGQADDPQLDTPGKLANPFSEGGGRELVCPRNGPDHADIDRYLRSQSPTAGFDHPTEKLFKTVAESIDHLQDKESWFLLVDSHGLRQPWDSPDAFAHYRTEKHLQTLVWQDDELVSADDLSTDQLKLLRCAYSDSCLFYDHAFGTLMEVLQRNEGIHVFFLSDHGLLIGDEGYVGYRADMQYPAVTDQALLVARPDGKVGECSDRVRPADLFSTILTLADMKPPFACDGATIDAIVRAE